MAIEKMNSDNSRFGSVRYFYSDRFFCDDGYNEFIQGKIKARELVTFDCCLMNMKEAERPELSQLKQDKQIMAIIVRPEIEPNYILEDDHTFEFCGYDLVEIQTTISAITDCGAEFKSIKYEHLNKYGLISTYREAVNAQLDLNEEDPEDPHAYCEIIEIWRLLPE